MKIWAHVNLGHTGGFWLLNICRAHPGNIWAWGEAPTNPKFSPQLLEGETLFDYVERERAAGKYASLGFIKSATMISYCARHGRVVRFVRNPIEVVGKKITQYWQAINCPNSDTPDLEWHIAQIEKPLGRPMQTEEDHFEGFIKRLMRMYHWLLDLNENWPLAKLEALNHSIGTDGLYFRRMMRYLTQVDWPIEFVRSIRDDWLPNPEAEESGDFTIPPHDAWQKYGWLYDPLPTQRWRSWDKWRQKIFLTHFEDIMLHLGYGW